MSMLEAEIARLKGLVQDAFIEGYIECHKKVWGEISIEEFRSYALEAWGSSNARHQGEEKF